MTLVSVVIPTHDRPAALARAVRSVLDQTLEDHEILVVNDHPDERGVLDLVSELGDPRIRYLRNQRTRGGAGARNTGLIRASGRYIALLDDDDEWMEDKLERQLRTMEGLSESWGGCYCGFQRYKNGDWESYPELKQGSILKDYLFSRNPVCIGSTFFFRRSALSRFGLFDEELERHQDIQFLACFLRYYQIAFVPGILVKVYGNHRPNAEQMERAKQRLFATIKTDIHEFEPPLIKAYHANECLALARCFSEENNFRKTLFYGLKSYLIQPKKLSKIMKLIFRSSPLFPSFNKK